MTTGEDRVARGWEALNGRLVELARPDLRDERFRQTGTLVNAPVSRGSTMLFADLDTMRRVGGERYKHTAIYGAMGSPVQHELERAVAALEGGGDTQIVSSGLAACTTALLTWTSSGGHCLVPDSCYGPTRRFADTILRRFGVETTYYDPMISEDALRTLMRPNTQVVFAESPGSHTFEVQDVPMLARVAHEWGARVLLDNTWGFGVFAPFAHGVDVSIQALTKYAGGHSDVIVGAITTAGEDDWQMLRDAAIQLGQVAGPDDCWLTLRGLRSMGVRLARQARTAWRVASWLREQPRVAQVLYPAFPECPGHEFWERDFTGAGPLFTVVLDSSCDRAGMERMINGLTRFGIGASWGGYESLVLPTTGGISRSLSGALPESPAFRLAIGLDDADDLIADLDAAFGRLNG
ncbi:cystathionine beta-lyase [Acetobacter sp.]|uniref:cystathionine beta-lyase n=1 Tax=Acetobacter sp. TaxID=440 RepID=UPI0039ED780E